MPWWRPTSWHPSSTLSVWQSSYLTDLTSGDTPKTLSPSFLTPLPPTPTLLGMNGFDKAIKDTGGPYLHFARLATISGDQKVCLVHCSARHLKKWAQVQDGELAFNKHQGSQIIENMNNALCNPNDVSVLLTFIMFFLIVQKLMVIDMMPCTSTEFSLYAPHWCHLVLLQPTQQRCFRIKDATQGVFWHLFIIAHDECLCITAHLPLDFNHLLRLGKDINYLTKLVQMTVVHSAMSTINLWLLYP